MIVALFPDEEALAQARRSLAAARIEALETYTPAPLRDQPTASPIPAIVLMAGLAGAAASLLLQSWSDTVAWPLPIGGRPQFAWPSFVPTVFENAILVAIVAGFAAFMLINRLPRLYDAVDEADAMREASRDGWVLAVRSEDEATLRRARGLLHALGAARVEEVAR